MKLTKSKKISVSLLGVAVVALVWDQFSQPPQAPVPDASAIMIKSPDLESNGNRHGGKTESEKSDGPARVATGTSGLVFYPDDRPNGAIAKPRVQSGKLNTAVDTIPANIVLPVKLAANKNAPAEKVFHDAATEAVSDGHGIALHARLQILASDECLDISELRNPFSIPQSWSGSAASTDERKPDISPAALDADLLSRKIREFKKEQARSIVVGPRGYVFVNGQGIFVGESYGDFILIAVEKDRAIFEIKGLQVSIPLVEDLKIQRRGTVIENLKTSESPAKSVSLMK